MTATASSSSARFLILPWVQSRGLASKILSIVARQLPRDWSARYGFTPVLFETFVETPRHRGTCYNAANWIHVGQTVGRGKKSRVHQQIIPIKDIWLYPLRKDFRSVLARSPPHGSTECLRSLHGYRAQPIDYHPEIAFR